MGRRGAGAVALGSEGMDGMRRGRPSGAGNARVLVEFLEHKIAGAGATVWPWREGVFGRFEVSARGLPWTAVGKFDVGGEGRRADELM
jgi:hypothetical protein